MSNEQLTLPGTPARTPQKRRRRSGYLCDAGADVLVAGSYVFKSEDPTLTVKNLRALVN